MMETNNATRTQFDIPEMLEVYEQEVNYETMEFDNNDDRCIIYFSSNGLYYPNDLETFRLQVKINNRFEWKRNILYSARKVIFLRDVTKQWYFDGINANINTIEKLAAWLTAQSRGLRVICVGSSAGGYAATLFGRLLNASHVFNFSGQFWLSDILQTEKGRLMNPTLARYASDANYINIFSLVDDIRYSTVPIFYFYPAKSAIDIAQCELVEDLNSVYKFAFDSDVHGSTCYEINFLDMFSSSLEDLLNLHAYYKDSLISPFWFSVKISGVLPSMVFKMRPYLKKLQFRRFFSLFSKPGLSKRS